MQYFTGDLDAVIAICRRIVGQSPTYVPAWRLLGAAYLQAGRAEEALNAFHAARPMSGPNAGVVFSGLVHATAAAGDRAAAVAWLDRWRQACAQHYLSPYHQALAHAGLAQDDEACGALDRACAERDPAVAYLAVEPRFGSLRAHPRFSEIVGRLGLR